MERDSKDGTVWVTPELAQKWLDASKRCRPLDSSKVQRLRGTIKGGFDEAQK